MTTNKVWIQVSNSNSVIQYLICFKHSSDSIAVLCQPEVCRELKRLAITESGKYQRINADTVILNLSDKSIKDWWNETKTAYLLLE